MYQEKEIRLDREQQIREQVAIPVAYEAMRSIEEMLRDVTDAAVANHAKTLRPIAKEETAIGRLQNPETRRLFVLAVRLDKLEDQATAAMELADTDEEKEKLHHEAHRYNMYYKLAMELRWCQIHEDIGGYWKDDIGVREGWMAVLIPPSKHPAQKLIEALMQGGM